MQAIYAEAGAPSLLRTEWFDGGHHCGLHEQETILQFFRQQLLDAPDGLPPFPGVETQLVYKGHGYVNNAVMTRFKGCYYCMWQQSACDEDTPDTEIRYARSIDGRSWSRPRRLVAPDDSTFVSPGGWIQRGDSLVALVNRICAADRSRGGTAWYVSTRSGRRWSRPAPVLMADGTPVDGIFEQDPMMLPEGRTVGAVHFRPGYQVVPVYTDDPSGVRGWRKARFPKGEGKPLEPSQYVGPDGSLVMFFRDQDSSFEKLSSHSVDRGESWTAPQKTGILDSVQSNAQGRSPTVVPFMSATRPVPGRAAHWRSPFPVTAVFSMICIFWPVKTTCHPSAMKEDTRPRATIIPKLSLMTISCGSPSPAIKKIFS